MKGPTTIALSGAPGSPYTRKMLGVLRYRRIPYRFMTSVDARDRNMPQPKVPLLPTFYFIGRAGVVEAMTDSSPIISRLEREWPVRSIVPSDPAVAFLDMLLEDYGDEWLTKPMFHYRWTYPADIKRAQEVLPLWRGVSRPDAVISEEGRVFADRQISRLRFVGSNPTTGPIIESSYLRLLELLNAHFRDHPYLMGRRPGASDFAIFGQLTQLAGFDPTPMALTLERAPRVYAWTTLLEDLSGAEPEAGDWVELEHIPDTLIAILAELGRTYVPVMLANAAALANGRSEVETTIDGEPWVQSPFPYQAKCLAWLREAYGNLSPDSRDAVRAILEKSACAALVH